jgi:hypothetical protein
MFNAKEWLVVMLLARGLLVPDGRMLFQYRLSTAEYLEVREVLRAAAHQSADGSEFLDAREVCALLVLYAAEWWRRDYGGGAWAWTPIFETFIPRGWVIPPQSRTHAVIRGIGYWHHLPGSESKRFFGVVVAHGGLPMRLIAQGSGKVRAVLSSALRLALRYRWDEVSVQDAIAERGMELVPALRHEEIYLLMAQMVIVVMELRREFELTGVSNPIRALDAQDAGWRERFPLALDDDSAQHLLSGLVQEAAQVIDTAGASGEFRVERLLRDLGNDRFELSSWIRHPPTMPTDIIASNFGATSDAVPRYFTVDAQVIERQALCDGRQTLGAAESTVSLMARHPHWRGDDACHEHLLFLRSIAGDLNEVAMAAPGGAALSPDDLLVFVQRDEQLVLVSTGNARIPEEEAVVVCALDYRVELDGHGSLVRPLGGCEIKGVELRVVAVKGDVRIVAEGVTFRVRTAQAIAPPDQYVWEGRRLPYPVGPWPIFLGTPKLFRYTADGERSRVNVAQLRWQSTGASGPVTVDAAQARGPVDVWLLEDGERSTRFRMMVVAPEARIAFTSGGNEREGSLRFAGWDQAEVAVLSEACVWTAHRSAHDLRIDLEVQAVPPQSVALRVKWPGSAREARLQVPFPATGGRFFDAQGRAMQKGATLSLHSLPGARLRVFDHNPQAPKKYRLRLSLELARVASGPRIPLESEHEVALQRDGTGETRLIDLKSPIQRLMALSDELDATVSMTLVAGTSPINRLRVTRYDAHLVKEGSTWRLSEEDLSRLDISSVERLGLSADPIASATGTTVALEQNHSVGVSTALWSADSLDLRQGPWLLYPTAESPAQFRPVIWSRTADPELEACEMSPACPLGEAMRLSDTDRRMAEIGVVVDAMCLDFQHASWTLLERNLTALRHLPLSSLDVCRVIAGHPAASVACAMRLTCSDAELVQWVRRMRVELGLVWELTSMRMWRSAALQIRPYYEALLGQELAGQVFPGFFASRVQVLSAEMPALMVPIHRTLLNIGAAPSEPLIEASRQIAKSVATLGDALWRGSESMAQKLLFRAHSAELDWPNLGLTQDALGAFHKVASPETLRKVTTALGRMFWLQPDFKVDVANMPVVCALWSVTEAPIDWWKKKDKSLALKRVRGFDPLWFEAAYQQGILMCLAAGLEPADA